MPREAQALCRSELAVSATIILAHSLTKWFSIVTVPLARGLLRIEMYWLKVDVPSIDGSFVRVSFQIVCNAACVSHAATSSQSPPLSAE